MKQDAGLPWDDSVGAAFLRVAAAYPQRTAVQRGEERLSYGELRGAVLRLAQAIEDQDPSGSGSVVILSGQEVEGVVAIMAALVAGRPYAMLDPETPAAMLRRLMDDLSPRVLITSDGDTTLVEALDAPATQAEDGTPRGRFTHVVWDRVSQAEIQQIATDANALAMILYSSGSTGQPKGIMHTHRTLMRHVAYVNEVSGIGPQDCIIALHPLNLGLSQARVLGALLSGARLLLYDARKLGINRLGDLLMEQGVSVLATVPALFRALCQDLADGQVLACVRLVQLGAAAVQWADVALFKRHFPPGAIFRLVYAASEAMGCTELLLDHESDEAAGPLAVGRAVEGKEILILDTERQPVPMGMSGEIAVRSEFLSPGYWRQPDLTKARFLADPDGGARRIYRTGDRGRLRPDGMLEIFGREDSLVKIRGHQVDLEAVERALRQLPGIEDAAVIARAMGRRDDGQTVQTKHGDMIKGGEGAATQGGEERLIAYYVTSVQPAPTSGSLRRALDEALPAPMIPGVFVAMPSLPCNAAGKVDRKALAALPPPTGVRPELEEPYREPSGAVEMRIATIWADVLEIDRVGADDHFLDLGGNSILAARIASRLLSDPGLAPKDGLSGSLSAATLFAAPTVAAMAALLQLRRQDDLEDELVALLAEIETLSDEQAEMALAVMR